MRRPTCNNGPVNAKRAARAKRGVSPLLVLGIVVLVAVLAAAGFLGWQLIGTNVMADRATQQQAAALKESWSAPGGAGAGSAEQPQSHEAAWLLRIPKLDLERPIIAGVDPADLAQGVGWYPRTALPGQVGNFAIAGYRLTNGEPLRRVWELSEGDAVIVETREAIFTYTIVTPPSELTVQDDAGWVLDPVPGKPEVVPTEAYLTVTTAEDLIGGPDRAVGFAQLTKTEDK